MLPRSGERVVRNISLIFSPWDPPQHNEPSLRPETRGWGLLPADGSCGGFSCWVLRCIGGAWTVSSEFGQMWAVLHGEISLEWHCYSGTCALFKSSKSVQHGRKPARKTLCRISVSRCQLDSSSALLQLRITHTCIAPVFRDLQEQGPHTLPTLSTSAILHLPHCPHSIHFNQNPPKRLVRGGDTEWKISAQMAEGKVVMDKQEGRDGENCQVSQQQPKHHLRGEAGLGSATPLCDTAPTPKSPGTGENASSKGLWEGDLSGLEFCFEFLHLYVNIYMYFSFYLV